LARAKFAQRALTWKINMSTPKLTNEIVAAAIAGFEQQKRQIDTQIAELRGWLSGASTEPTAALG
jgi:hypothetical protein